MKDFSVGKEMNLDATPILGTGLEVNPTSNIVPVSETGFEINPTSGTGFEINPTSGTSFEATPVLGAGLEATPTSGTGFEATPVLGTGFEATPVSGIGFEATPVLGTPISGVSLEEVPTSGTGLEIRPISGEDTSWDGVLENRAVSNLESTPSNIEVMNLNSAHQNSLKPKKISDIPYTELFKQDVKEIDAIPIDIFFSEEVESEPEKETIEVEISDDEVLEIPEFPKEHQPQENFETPPKLPTKREEKSTETPEFENDVSNPFLAKVSELKDDVLGDSRDSVGVGMFYKTRSGEAGLDALDTFVLPTFDAHIYLGMSHHLYGNFNLLNMNSGTIVGDANDRYGANEGGNVEAISNLGEWKVGYQYLGDDDSITLEYGSAPSPAVSPTVENSWKIKYSTKFGKISLDVAYVNKSVKDTMLSWVGDRYEYKNIITPDDPETALINEENSTIGSGVRGGITKQGFEIGLKHSHDGEIVAGNLNYYKLTGYKVMDNEEMALTLLYLRLLDIDKIDTFMVGPILIYDNYTYSSSYFTMGQDGYGNGGYFSPKNFILLGVYADAGRVVDEKFFWKVKGNAGIMSFTNGADMFREESVAEEAGGFGYDLKLFGGYKLDSSLQLLGGMGYQYAENFANLFFGLNAVYYFGSKGNSVGDLSNASSLREMAE